VREVRSLAPDHGEIGRSSRKLLVAVGPDMKPEENTELIEGRQGSPRK
jgi:hypothetical protein